MNAGYEQPQRDRRRKSALKTNFRGRAGSLV